MDEYSINPTKLIEILLFNFTFNTNQTTSYLYTLIKKYGQSSTYEYLQKLILDHLF